MKPADLLSATQAAERSGVTVRSIHKAIREGRLVSMRVAGYLLIHRDALNDYIANRGKRRPGAGRKRKTGTSTQGAAKNEGE